MIVFDLRPADGQQNASTYRWGTTSAVDGAPSVVACAGAVMDCDSPGSSATELSSAIAPQSRFPGTLTSLSSLPSLRLPSSLHSAQQTGCPDLTCTEGTPCPDTTLLVPGTGHAPRSLPGATPNTPPASNALAAASPTLTSGTPAAPAGSPRGSAQGVAAGSLEAAVQAAAKAAAVAAIWGRIQSFMHSVLGSPLVISALLGLEVEESHPVHEDSGMCGLQWTLAQMLALHLRAGYASATETQLLSLLWTIESWGNVWRGPCTTVLQSYLQHLTLVDRKRAMAMRRDWPNQFRSLRREMSECQLDLLKKLDWQLRLDFGSELGPCRDLLFRLPQTPSTPTRPADYANSPRPEDTPPQVKLGSVREAWVLRMDALCDDIRRQAAAAVAEAARTAAAADAAAQAAEGEVDVAERLPSTPAVHKRQRYE